ncbi:MAG: hypothetical protein HW402_677 [Dehalococcoidales bacterium]|nr:hypothetical protein [Dehalococcoidales bacterium]
MSKFIDKLKQLSRVAPQPIGFRTTQTASLKPRIQMVATLAEENSGLARSLAGADAGLLRLSKLTSGAGTITEVSRAMPDIPWGLWVCGQKQIVPMSKIGGDFVVFPAATTPLKLFESSDAGKILEIETSLTEGLLRTANELPVDAVLISREERKDDLLTWQDLMLFQRLAALVTKPILASVPPNVSAAELRALWETGIDCIVIEVSAELPANRLAELRQLIDQTDFPLPRKRGKSAEPRIPYLGREMSKVTSEEEEGEEEEDDE